MESINLLIFVWTATVFCVLHLSLLVTFLMTISLVVHYVAYWIDLDIDWDERFSTMKSMEFQQIALASVTFSVLCVVNYSVSGGYTSVKILF